MPTDLSKINPSDEWYKEGFKHTETISLRDDVQIRILPVTYFLATKFSAFNDRSRDARTSKDFEDIIYITDNCSYLTNAIDKANERVKIFLIKEYNKLWNNKHRDEIIACHLAPLISEARLPLIKKKLESIIKT